MEERKETLKFDEFVFYMLARSFKKKNRFKLDRRCVYKCFCGVRWININITKKQFFTFFRNNNKKIII